MLRTNETERKFLDFLMSWNTTVKINTKVHVALLLQCAMSEREAELFMTSIRLIQSRVIFKMKLGIDNINTLIRHQVERNWIRGWQKACS